MLAGVKVHSSIFDVAHSFDQISGPHVAALKRIFSVTGSYATCHVGSELSSKYKVPQDNKQFLVSITNRYTLEQTWFNEARTQKPQTFSQGSEFLDPTSGGASCDFCRWPTLTATDPGFGRIELPHAVTGSNLFKYAEPGHGIVLFKHHEPLQFSQAALSDLLVASWLWFTESHKQNPDAAAAFLLWNCLPRAGASQYHGHAQVMLTEEPVPGVVRLQRAAATYQQQHQSSYYSDLLKAHAALGLLRQVSIPAPVATAAAAAAAPGGGGGGGGGSDGAPGGTAASAAAGNGSSVPAQGASSNSGNSNSGIGDADGGSNDHNDTRNITGPDVSSQQQQQQQHLLLRQKQRYTAWSFPSIAPCKDMEVVVVGSHLCCPAFQKLLHASLRAIIDGCGCRTFNCGVLNLDVTAAAPAGALHGQHGRLSWHNSSSSSKSSGCNGNNCSNNAADGEQQTGSDSVSCSISSSSNVSEDWNSRPGSSSSSNGSNSSSSNEAAAADIILSIASSEEDLWIPDADFWGPQGPVVARLVSRGKLTSVASDFGGLEVFGGASIGHTDPFLIVKELDVQLHQAAAATAAAAAAVAGGNSSS